MMATSRDAGVAERARAIEAMIPPDDKALIGWVIAGIRVRGYAICWWDREDVEGRLERPLTQREWDRLASHLEHVEEAAYEHGSEHLWTCLDEAKIRSAFDIAGEGAEFDLCASCGELILKREDQDWYHLGSGVTGWVEDPTDAAHRAVPRHSSASSTGS